MTVRRTQILLASALCALLWTISGCRMGFDPSHRCFLDQDCTTASDIAPDGETPDAIEDTVDVPDEPEVTDLGDEDTPPVPPCANEGDCDEDGVEDTTDNCPDQWNPSQLNWDNDNLGDECDPCPFVDQGLTGGLCPGPDVATACNLEGVWVGHNLRFLTKENGPAFLFTETAEVVFDKNGQWAHELSGSAGSYSCPAPGIVWIQSDDAVMDPIALTLGPREEIAAGNGFTTAGRVENGNWSVYVRAGKAPEGSENLVVAENAGKPGSGTVTPWKLVGVAGKDTGTTPIMDISGSLQVLAPSAESTEPIGVVEGELTLSWADSTIEPIALQLKTHPDQGPPTLQETAQGKIVLTMWVTTLSEPNTFMQFEMTGQINRSRDVVILTGYIPANQVSHTAQLVLVRQGDTPATDAPTTTTMLTGAGPSAAIRGLLPQGATVDAPAGLVIHPNHEETLPSGQQPTIVSVSVTEKGQVVIVPNDALYPLGAPNDPLTSHRLCMDWAPSGAVALTAICANNDGTTSCSPEQSCTMRLGLAFPRSPSAANFANDYDLDGVGSVQLDGCAEVGNPNKSSLWDACPCLLAPGNTDVCASN